MKRGELWWAALADPIGSAPGYRRPVLVLQCNAFNQSRIATVVVASITSNLALADAPGNVRLPKSDSGLPQASVLNVSQIMTLDKRLLVKSIKSLSPKILDKAEQGIRLVLGL